MKLQVRNRCVVCEGPLRHLHTFDDFPIYMGVDKKDQHTPTAPMKWGACMGCGCVQLEELVDPDILYARHHNPAVGETWAAHHAQLAEIVTSCVSPRAEVLELGGANLKLANNVCRRNKTLDYTIVDRSCGKYKTEPVSKKIVQIKKMFVEYQSGKKFECIVHSHTLEHAYQPAEFLEEIRERLVDGGTMIMSVPNISAQLKAGHLNAINFEHTYYLDDNYLLMLVLNAGFKIEKIQQFSEWNNFYVCRKVPEKTEIKHCNPSNARHTFEYFINTLQKDVRSLNKRIGPGPVYSFGAHIFNQYMLSSGLRRDPIMAILDNDPNKVGAVLAGTNIPIVSAAEIRNLRSPRVVVRGAQYTSEIRKQLLGINAEVELL